MEAIIFYIFAILAVAGAVLVVSHKNPVSSALFLVLTLFATAVLFILLLADFIAVIQILVYAGAIMVLFLFTVMFLNLRPKSLEFDSKSLFFKMSAFFVVLMAAGYFASIGFRKGLSFISPTNIDPKNFGSVEGVGKLLFSDYILPFELTSVLIVVAIIGVVAIAKRREG